MENKKTYSAKKLKKFKKLIQKKLKKSGSDLKSMKGLRLDQKKYIAQADMSFSDDSRRFENRAFMNSMVTRMKSKNKKLKAALARIENGTYGICKKTGKLISEARLKAMPTARLSMNAKKKKIKKK
ncbi:MAG: TraR/DksA family transcriptional regulator [Saprospiraceae bacterium]